MMITLYKKTLSTWNRAFEPRIIYYMQPALKLNRILIQPVIGKPIEFARKYLSHCKAYCQKSHP